MATFYHHLHHADRIAHTASPSLSDASSTSHSDLSSWRNSTDSSCTEFDDICSISDTCSEVVPLKVSDSIRRMVGRPPTRLAKPPSLLIPLTPAWPPSASSQAFSICLNPLSASDTPLSPAALVLLGCSSPPLAPPCATPSLDGGYDSSASASADSPSTPESQNIDQALWESSIQLQSKAMDVLLQLSPDFQKTTFDEETDDCTIRIPEMEQRPADAAVFEQSLTQPTQDMEDDYEPLSAISVPSPGGFFASLGPSSQQLWGVPGRPTGQPRSLAETILLGRRINPPALLPAIDLPVNLATQTHINDVETSATIHRDPHQVEDKPAGSTERTQLWLSKQEAYLCTLLSPYPIPDRQWIPSSPTPSQQSPASPAPSQQLPAIPAPTQQLPSLPCESNMECVNPTSKKCVRFAETRIEFPPLSPKACDSLLLRTFQHLMEQSNLKDAFFHATARFEALQMQRLYLPDAHRSFLQGNFVVRAGTKPKLAFLDFSAVEDDVTAATQRTLIANASKEQQMLQQVAPAVWNIAGQKFLSGGSLLSRPSLDMVRSRASKRTQTRILDIEVQPAARWGWAVALEHSKTQVFTAVVASDSPWAGADWSMHSEPSNHRTVHMPSRTTLPFPSNSFHVVSARTLHTLLRCASNGNYKNVDEWTDMLAEIYRVLAPGGVVQFSLLDATATAPSGSKLECLSKSFATELRSLGYDPLVSQSFLERLSRAGFEDFRRTWMSLPLGHSVGIEAVTGLVGSLAWEDWLVQLQHESEDERQGSDGLLGRLGEALAELVKGEVDVGQAAGGKRQWAGWKMLVGCAVKPESLYDDNEE